MNFSEIHSESHTDAKLQTHPAYTVTFTHLLISTFNVHALALLVEREARLNEAMRVT